jgi:hypothetical protein
LLEEKWDGAPASKRRPQLRAWFSSSGFAEDNRDDASGEPDEGDICWKGEFANMIVLSVDSCSFDILCLLLFCCLTWISLSFVVWSQRTLLALITMVVIHICSVERSMFTAQARGDCLGTQSMPVTMEDQSRY